MEHTGRIASAESLLLDLIVSLARQQPASTITLQGYLENLRWLAWRWSDREALPFAEFVELLCLAFASKSVGEEARGDAVDAFLAWDERVTEQILCLIGMKNPESPESHQDPYTYLECAVARACDRWQVDDEACRLREVTWEEFADFLNAGQGYGPAASLVRDARGRRGAEA